MVITNQATCPVCGGIDFDIVVQLNEARRDRYLSFCNDKYGGLLSRWLSDIAPEVVRCENCVHYWYRNQPSKDQLGKMYASAKKLGDQGLCVRVPTKKIERELTKLGRLVKTKQRPKFLDYGSGFGRWARSAVEAGFEVTAFEPALIRGTENEKVDFEVVHNIAELKDRKFDVINLEQVLEHLPDPLSTMRQIKNFCHKDTILRVTVPNMYRVPEGKDLWRDWPYDGIRVHTMAPYEHLQGFTPNSLRKTLENAGYKIRRDFSMWRHYPLDQIRHLIGLWLPNVDKTICFIRIN